MTRPAWRNSVAPRPEGFRGAGAPGEGLLPSGRGHHRGKGNTVPGWVLAAAFAVSAVGWAVIGAVAWGVNALNTFTNAAMEYTFGITPLW